MDVRYFIEDLIEACNSSLYEYAGISDGIKRRQIFEDIKFMESEAGWSISLERKKDGRRVYYRYSESGYSIKNQTINQTEAEQLRETLAILTRFKGMPQFDWIEELMVRIKDTFQLSGNTTAFISFEQNPYLKGLNYFTEIFNAIQNKTSLKIKYQGFKQQDPTENVISPWYLKQYNNRWFLFGFNEHFHSMSNMALDRILELSETSLPFIDNTEIDFDEFFEDVIGVSIPNQGEVVKVILKIEKPQWNYIKTKPIHGSQKIKEETEDFTIIELELIPNFEFESLVLSFGEFVKIVAPEDLKLKLKLRIKQLYKKY